VATDLPEATVVIPTRDRWPVLSRAALASARAQEAVEVEIVVVDDGSTDGTAEQVDRLGDDRVRVVRHERSRGVAAARNAGIAAARGRWIAFLDDDDLWAPRKLRAQLDAAEAAGAVFAYTAGAAVDERHRFLFNVAAPDAETITNELLQWNVIWCGCSNVAARADVVHELGGFDVQLAQLADWDLWIRLALAGPAAAATDVLVAYTIHEQNMLLTARDDVFPEFDRLVRKHATAAQAHGVQLDGARFARWVAMGHRRAGRRRLAAATYLGAALRHRDLGSALRAVGALLGEPTLRAGRRFLPVDRRSRLVTLPAPEPAWLAVYR
jgi:glycosyltransferase involved in cell wall biosynthesis